MVIYEIKTTIRISIGEKVAYIIHFRKHYQYIGPAESNTIWHAFLNIPLKGIIL